MANELNLYQVAYTVHRRRLDRKEREQSSDTRWDVGAAADEAVRKTLAHAERFDRPPEGWATERIEITAVEQVGTLRRCAECGEFRADDRRILCVCGGLRCKRCGKRKIHRPVSDYYDERDGHLWHVPWFGARVLCTDCQPVDRAQARAWAAALGVDPRARLHGRYSIWDVHLGKKVKSRSALVANGRKHLAELLARLADLPRDPQSPLAKTLAAAYSDGDDRAVFLVYAAVSTRETVRCEIGWLEGLMPAVFRTGQREALLARGFAVSEVGPDGPPRGRARLRRSARPGGVLRA